VFQIKNSKIYSLSVSKGLSCKKKLRKLYNNYWNKWGNLVILSLIPQYFFYFRTESNRSGCFSFFYTAHPDYVTVMECVYAYCSPCHKHTGKHRSQLTNSTCVCLVHSELQFNQEVVVPPKPIFRTKKKDPLSESWIAVRAAAQDPRCPVGPDPAFWGRNTRAWSYSESNLSKCCFIQHSSLHLTPNFPRIQFNISIPIPFRPLEAFSH
jgi:hypothetical protein